MKNIRDFILLVFLVTLSANAGARDYYRVVNVEADDTLSVRAKPSVHSKRLGYLYPYDTGIIIDRCKKRASATWCKIDFLPDNVFFFERGLSDGGWVNKRYLKRANNIIPYADRTYRVVNVASDDVLTVRKHPTRHGRILGSLLPDDRCVYATQCQQVDKYHNWCYVGYDYHLAGPPPESAWKIAELGWVNMKYLRPYDGSECNTSNNKFYNFVYPGEAF